MTIKDARLRKEYFRAYSRAHYLRKRQEALNLLGGRCVVCGSIKKLEFDHIDPNTKSFNVTDSRKYSWARVLAELEKCQVLCHGHHHRKSAEYFRRRDGSGRRIARGEKLSVLRAEDVLLFRKRWEGGGRQSVLAREFGVTRGTIYNIVYRKTWSHLPSKSLIPV